VTHSGESATHGRKGVSGPPERSPVVPPTSAVGYDGLAPEYARYRRLHPGVLGKLVSTGAVKKSSAVLELGCGTGNYIVTLESLVGCRGWGLDKSESMLARARERSVTITFTADSSERLDFRPDFFDLVFSVDVIHHVVNRPHYFREASRVLKPGGKICTVTETDWMIRTRKPLSEYFPETVEVELRRYPRLPEIRELMDRVGFGQIHEGTVEFPYQINSAGPYREKVYAALQLIGEVAFQRGLSRLEQDVRRRPIPCLSRYVMLWGTKVR
jgi:SAM-dependent methyltransferase